MVENLFFIWILLKNISTFKGLSEALTKELYEGCDNHKKSEIQKKGGKNYSDDRTQLLELIVNRDTVEATKSWCVKKGEKSKRIIGADLEKWLSTAMHVNLNHKMRLFYSLGRTVRVGGEEAIEAFALLVRLKIPTTSSRTFLFIHM